VNEADKELNLAALYHSLIELLQDFGTERPTLVIVVGNRIKGNEEEIAPFLSAFSELGRYQLDILGLGEDFDAREARKMARSLNARIIPIKSFSAQLYDDYLLSAISRLLSDRAHPGPHD
jgi:hypothetical protein